MYSPSGSLLEISPRETKAYVVDRREFDEHMLGLAVDSGVSFVNDSVKSASKNVLRVSGGEFKHDRLVLATGTNYTLQNKMGLNVPKEFLIGAQYDLKVDCHSDFVELHFIVPDFFAWVIPVDGFARVGLCSHGNPRPLLDGFVKKLRSGGRLKSDRVLGKTYGIIPVHSPRMRTQYGNIMLVGDSAGQVKATTGGGVVLGCMAAELTKYEDYESRWRKKIGRELYLHLLIHRFMGRIPPEKIDLLFSILHDNKDVIEEKGDMDLASKTVFALLAKPRFLYEAALNLPAFMASLLYHKS